MNPLAEKILNRTRAVPLAVDTAECSFTTAECSYANNNEVFPHSAAAIITSNAPEVTEADLGLAFLAAVLT